MAMVLILDDEEKIRELLKISLQAEGYNVMDFSTAEEVYETLAVLTRKGNYGPADMLLITDIRMPDVNGLEVIDHVHAAYPGMKIIICSSMAESPTVKESFEVWQAQHEIVAVFEKPINHPKLLSKVNEVLKNG